MSSDRHTQWFAVIIILANIAMIGVPAVSELLGASPFGQFNISRDQSYPEMLNYAQTALCALLLIASFFRKREPVFLALAALFVAIGLDDSLSYHEKFGLVLADAFSLSAIPGLRPVDTGELVAWALAATVFVPLLLLTGQRSEAFGRAAALVLIVCLAGLIFCAVGIDMLHILVPNRLIAYIEDGGEMLNLGAASIACFAFWRAARLRSSLAKETGQDRVAGHSSY